MVTLKRIIIDIQASLIEPTVLTRVTGTTVIEILIPATIVGTVVSTIVDGTAVPRSIVFTAYYSKSCI